MMPSSAVSPSSVRLRPSSPSEKEIPRLGIQGQWTSAIQGDPAPGTARKGRLSTPEAPSQRNAARQRLKRFPARASQREYPACRRPEHPAGKAHDERDQDEEGEHDAAPDRGYGGRPLSQQHHRGNDEHRACRKAGRVPSHPPVLRPAECPGQEHEQPSHSIEDAVHDVPRVDPGQPRERPDEDPVIQPVEAPSAHQEPRNSCSRGRNRRAAAAVHEPRHGNAKKGRCF